MKKHLLTIAALAALATTSQAAVVISDSQFFTASGNYTLGSGSNQVLVVAAGERGGSDNFSITYGGLALTKAVGFSQNESGNVSSTAIYYLADFTGISGNALSLSGGGGNQGQQYFAMTLSGVDTTVGPIAVTGTNGTNTTPINGTTEQLSLTMNSLTVGNTIISASQTNFLNNNASILGNAPSTNVSLVNQTATTSGSSYFGVGSTSVASTSETLAWAVEGQFGARSSLVAVEFVAAATQVPEPSTFAALAGLGVLGFAATRRRRA